MKPYKPRSLEAMRRFTKVKQNALDEAKARERHLKTLRRLLGEPLHATNPAMIEKAIEAVRLMQGSERALMKKKLGELNITASDKEVDEAIRKLRKEGRNSNDVLKTVALMQSLIDSRAHLNSNEKNGLKTKYFHQITLAELDIEIRELQERLSVLEMRKKAREN